MTPTPLRLLLLLPLALGVAGCGAAERLAEVGRPPQLAGIDNPASYQNWQPVALPLPPQEPGNFQPNSLWRSGSRAFFRDQRAGAVGDILTVVIKIDDEAKLNNTSRRSRDNAEGVGLDNFLGLETNLAGILPDEVQPDALVKADSTSNSRGTGTIDRQEEIDLRVAAVVTQRLPNGNLVIQGRQQVRVNFELRDLYIGGVIRPEDIGSDNTIPHDKIAEARISYGGRGHVSDIQQPRYGQQIYDILFPF